MTPLLSVENLRVTYTGRDADRIAVDGISFTVEPGEIVALVGESGSGKTATGLAIMGILSPNARVAPGGAIRFEGRDLLATSSRHPSETYVISAAAASRWCFRNRRRR